MMDNEKDLLKRLAEGDEDAFHRIFNYYYPRTMVFLSRMIADREDVRDMAQNIFIRIWLMKELKGFTQVEIGAGDSITVTIPLDVSDLGFYGSDLEYRVEPGEFDIMVGPSSDDEQLLLTKLTLI